MSLRERIAQALLGDHLDKIVAKRLAQQLGAVSVRVDDSPGWEALAGGGPADRPWAEKYSDLEQTLEAWQKNFLVRRLVTLTRSYALGNGITITSDDPHVQDFIGRFWDHRQNRLDQRLGPMCDELTRAGEIFPILFTNPVDGLSYLRLVPASRIRTIETDPDDYEKELRYAQTREASTEPKWWIGPDHPNAFKPQEPTGPGIPTTLPPLMLHFAVNRPIGATRGESDLTPVLPWAKRYSEWLKDRVRLNRIRTRQAILHLRISDPALVEQKRQQIRTDNPIEKGIYVSGPDEELIAHDLRIASGDAEDDGRILRLACATGGNVALHYMGEGETVNYATAREMGEPTTRFYAERQQQLITIISDLITYAYYRHCITTAHPYPGDDQLQLQATTAEVARKDNESLALAAKDIVTALAEMKAQGWIDDQTAATLAFKFAGEPIGEHDVARILAKAATPSPAIGTGAKAGRSPQGGGD